MCGIYGLSSASILVDQKFLQSRIDLLAHRGPNDSGCWVSPDKRTGFAHRRLSIVDLSPAGHQPMTLDEGQLSIVFNGEIYNHLAIRQELISKGFVFNGHSDTEVLLASYKCWGTSCLDHFNGMFAFVICDLSNTDKPFLFFARDRAGEKPFYYRCDNRSFEFSSEVRALSHSKDFELESLDFYLLTGYMPQDKSIFSGVNKLPPGYFGIYNLLNRSLNTYKYWDLPENKQNINIDEEYCLSKVSNLLEESVKIRLDADVPVGVFLSGGLDSSLVAAAAAKVSAKPINTFTMTLPGSSLNEEKYAKSVASFIGSSHHVLELEEISSSFLDSICSFVDEPIADSSIIPSLAISRLASQHVKVVLGGDGGDELFGGYSIYKSALQDASNLRFIPPYIFKLIAFFASKLPAGTFGRNRLSSLKNGPFQQLVWGTPYFDASLRSRLINKNFRQSYMETNQLPEDRLLNLFYSGVDPVDSMLRTHFKSALTDDFLVKVDRSSMTYGMEQRSPFLDHNLIEFCYQEIPSSMKVTSQSTRIIQKKLAESWFPKKINFDRKQGFSIPINDWLRRENERKLMGRMQGLPEIINMDFVRTLIKGHVNGKNNGGRLFSLIMLAASLRNS